MKLKGSFRALVFLVPAFIAVVLLSSLVGCASGQTTLHRVLNALSSESDPLPEEAQKQLERFAKREQAEILNLEKIFKIHNGIQQLFFCFDSSYYKITL